MRSLCIYCGASHGNSPRYAEAAVTLARELVRHDLALVYGGGNIGLMGRIADAVLELGGRAIGVIPQALLDREVGHRGLTELHIVADMHARKAMMAELADGFAALPGGFGTMEELFEMLTWAQLGFHAKPVGLLNVAGFYDPLLAFVRHQVAEGFLPPDNAALLHADADPARLVETLRRAHPAAPPGALPPDVAKKLV
ncbi:MAG: TIGR00730 family Rossman fold protein [Burkholderiaceae bacterium]